MSLDGDRTFFVVATMHESAQKKRESKLRTIARITVIPFFFTFRLFFFFSV